MSWMFAAVAVVMVITCSVTDVHCQRAPTWDSCGCYWGTWESWSKCSRLCYGRQSRSRAVWHHDTPNCEGFRVCDAGQGGWEYQSCNRRCTYGSYDSSNGGCRCPRGRYGTCCDNVLTCGEPQSTPNGSYDKSNGNDYGSVATYSCNVDYNMTGVASRTCTRIRQPVPKCRKGIICRHTSDIKYIDVWTGETPKCIFAQSCRRGPCHNGGTCFNGLDKYTCVCPPGWSGINCQQDIQPPVMTDCSGNTTMNTPDREVKYSWSVPSFVDPHGNDVTMTSNYVNNFYSFPWGDFFIQYVITKPSNGMQTECKFQLKIRPNPCPELPSLENGFIACNKWRSDYGQYCLSGCFENYTLPRDIDENQWYVCGSSGTWSTETETMECEELADSTSVHSSGDILGRPNSCLDVSEVKLKYINQLKRSDFNSVCTNHPEMCTMENVEVKC